MAMMTISAAVTPSRPLIPTPTGIISLNNKIKFNSFINRIEAVKLVIMISFRVR